MAIDKGKEAAYKILSACQEMAPNGEAQAGFTKLHNEMVADCEDWGDIINALCRRLSDGITHGNWPSA